MGMAKQHHLDIFVRIFQILGFRLTEVIFPVECTGNRFTEVIGNLDLIKTLSLRPGALNILKQYRGRNRSVRLLGCYLGSLFFIHCDDFTIKQLIQISVFYLLSFDNK
ncbi:MAG: hypothetical protein ABGU93_02705 [Acetobacterium sp.]|uniref:hypothetical protein n=1 Tax=Acetobacterium sp. TaxID=1872094 RepID=UPI003242A844